VQSETLTAVSLATIAFVGGHFLLSWTPVRGALVARLGRGAFLGVYSVLVAAAFVWMNLAYVRSPVFEMWEPTEAGWIATLVLMPFAAIFLVCGIATPNPTAVHGERVLDRPDPTRGIFRVTRHPILWSIALWAMVHVAATGDTASLIFFGGLVILALAGMAHIDARKRATDPERFRLLAAATSVVPFRAIVEGRARFSLSEIGWGRIVGGLALYLILLYGHEWVIGIIVAPQW
jgi:uncharacterized membrane protein